MQRSLHLATAAGIVVVTVAAGLIGGVATGTPRMQRLRRSKS